MNADSYIDTDSYDDVLDHELTQFLVREAVALAMDTPLRDPILEGVEGTDDEDERDERDESAVTDVPEEPAEEGGGLPTGLGLFLVAVVVAVAYLSRRRGGE